MHHTGHSAPQSHRSLIYAAAAALLLASLLPVACSDDEADILQPTGGSGGAGGDGNPLGGFGMGPSGPGPGAGGNGGSGAEGGTGNPTFTWDNVYGDAVANGAPFNDANTLHPKDVAIDSNGNIIVVGAFTTTSINTDAGIDLGGGVGNLLESAGGDDVFVAKYDAAGQWIWSIGVGDAASQGALSVAIDSSDNIWVSGTVKGTFAFPSGNAITNGGGQFPDAWIAKLDTNGAAAGFEASYGQDSLYSESGRALAAGPLGTILFAGTFQDNIDIGAGHVAAASADYGMFLARYDNTNTITFDAVFGDASAQDATAVALGIDGAMAIGGSTDGNIDFGGGEIVNGTGEPRAVVASLNAAGEQQYAMVFTGNGPSEVVDLVYHSSGDLFVVGTFAQTIDLGGGELSADGGAKEMFVARYDPSGNLIYGRRIGGVGLDEPAGIAVDSNGFVTTVGRFNDDIVVNADTTLDWDATLNDAFVIRLGPPGQGYWGYNPAALNNAQATGVATDPNDDTVVVIGEYTGQIDLGSGAKGINDVLGMFIAKYASMGD